MIDPHRLFGTIRLRDRTRVAVAVSGGSDSLALLLLLRQFLSDSSIRPVALTVDHGLRPGSAAEAERVGAFCRERGIEHEVLEWRGAKPSTGIAAAARAARYELLAAAASRAGTNLILTGHTRDDQAETVVMRSARGGETGLGAAGMAPATLHGLRNWIVRPLLNTSRAALRQYLLQNNAEWIEDPSNREERYERVRVRRQLQAADDPEETRSNLVRQAAAAARRREALAVSAAELIDRYASQCISGLHRLDPALFAPGSSAPRAEAGLHAFRVLLAVTGGGLRLPDRQRSRALLDKLCQPEARGTLARTVAVRRANGVFLYRENRGSGPSRTELRDQAVWDRRYRLHCGAVEPGLEVAALGREMAKSIPVDTEQWPVGLVRAARAAGPALWRGPLCLGPVEVVAETDGDPANGPKLFARSVPGPWLDFLPSFDWDLAVAACRLLGHPKIDPIPV